LRMREAEAQLPQRESGGERESERAGAAKPPPTNRSSSGVARKFIGLCVFVLLFVVVVVVLLLLSSLLHLSITCLCNYLYCLLLALRASFAPSTSDIIRHRGIVKSPPQ